MDSFDNVDFDICCHTYPNDKLLQHEIGRYQKKDAAVVIPIQTISFYNNCSGYPLCALARCHTYPNDKLLQHFIWDPDYEEKLSCHTYPNDKLLQLSLGDWSTTSKSCHTYPNDKLLQQSCLKDFEKVVWP